MITIGPWEPRAHFRNCFLCILFGIAMDFVNYLQGVGGLAERPCALSLLGVMLSIRVSRISIFVRGLVVVLYHTVLGTNQEEVYV